MTIKPGNYKDKHNLVTYFDLTYSGSLKLIWIVAFPFEILVTFQVNSILGSSEVKLSALLSYFFTISSESES